MVRRILRLFRGLNGTGHRCLSGTVLALALTAPATADAVDVGSSKHPKYKNLDSILSGVLAEYERRIRAIEASDADVPQEGDDRSPKKPVPPSSTAEPKAAAREAARQEAARQAAAQAPMHKAAAVAVTFHVKSAAHAEALVRFLNDNGGSSRNWGEDYVEAYVPVPLLGEAARQPGVLRAQAMVPPQPFSAPPSSALPSSAPPSASASRHTRQ